MQRNIQKALKVCLAVLLILTTGYTVLPSDVRADEINGSAGNAFSIQESVAYSADNKGATITLDAAGVPSGYTLTSVKDPTGMEKDLTNLAYVVSANGSYDFIIAYTDSAAKAGTYTKTVSVSDITASENSNTVNAFSIQESVAYSADSASATITLDAASVPSGYTLTSVKNPTGAEMDLTNLTCTVTANGSYSFMIAYTDSAATAGTYTKTVSVTEIISSENTLTGADTTEGTADGETEEASLSAQESTPDMSTMSLEPQSTGTPINPASASVQTGYKQTASLTDADKANDYQKNYTYSADSTTDAYLYKTAEWVDKEQGKAKITLTGKAPAHEPTSCVYVIETCLAHSFTDGIGRQNIKYLLQFYDKVDVIINNGASWDSMEVYKDVQSSDVLDHAIYDYDRHSSSWMYGALLKYFMGGSPTSTTQVEFPTAVYVSMDFITLEPGQTMSLFGPYIPYDQWAAGNGGYNSSLWPVLKNYVQAGHYFLMTTDNAPTMTTTQPIGTNEGDFIRMYDPSQWDVANFSSTPQYYYGNDFKTVGIPMFTDFYMEDESSSDYVITGATSDSGTVTFDKNHAAVGFTHNAYQGQEVTMTLDVQMTAQQMTDWLNTNNSAKLYHSDAADRSLELSTDSPKLYRNSPLLYISKLAIDQNYADHYLTGNMPDTTFSYSVLDSNGNIVTGALTCVKFTKKQNTVESSVITDGTFTLKDGQYVVLAGLPAGTYKIAEANAGNRWWSEYTVGSPGVSIPDTATYTKGLRTGVVTLTNGYRTDAAYKNHYVQTSSLQLEKVVSSYTTAPSGSTFSYEFVFTKPDGMPLTEPIAYTGTGGAPSGTVTLDANGRGTISGIPANGVITFNAIPVGTTFAFRETTVTAGGVTAPVTANWTTNWYVDPTAHTTPAASHKYIFKSTTAGTYTTGGGYEFFPTALSEVAVRSSATTYTASFTFPAGTTFSSTAPKNKWLSMDNLLVPKPEGADNSDRAPVIASDYSGSTLTFNIGMVDAQTTLETWAANANLNRRYTVWTVSIPEVTTYTSDLSGTGTQSNGTVGEANVLLLYENTYDPKTALTVTKNTVAQNGGIIDPNKTYSFQLKNSGGTNLSGSQTYTLSSTGAADQTMSTTNGAFTLKNGETATFKGLSNTTYQVAETSPGAGWTQEYAIGAAGANIGGYSTGATASAALTANKTTQVVFRNTYNPAKLTVSKTVVGAPSGASKETFEFTLTKAGSPVGNAPYTVTDDTTVRYTDSNGHFYLQGGQTATIVNLLPDTSANAYRVIETPNDLYTTATTGGDTNITINAGATGIVSYTNKYSPPMTGVNNSLFNTWPVVAFLAVLGAAFLLFTKRFAKLRKKGRE